MFLVTVIVRTYNRCNLLSRALQSIVDQKFDHNDMQVVVVDDASIDNTKDIVSEFSSKLNINYLKHAQNMGVAASLQDGIKAADSKYIMLLDDDDLYHPGMVRTCLNVMENDEELSFVYTNWVEKDALTGQETIVCAQSYEKRTGKQAYIDTVCNKLKYVAIIGCYRKCKMPNEIPSTLTFAEDTYLSLCTVFNGFVKGIDIPLYTINIHNSHTWRGNANSSIPWYLPEELSKSKTVEKYIIDLMYLDLSFAQVYINERNNNKTLHDIVNLWKLTFLHAFNYRELIVLSHFLSVLFKRTLPFNSAYLKSRLKK